MTTRPDFAPPFRCGVGTYFGTTYDGHSPWSTDFNRGTGTDDLGDPVFASADGVVIQFLKPYGQVKVRHASGYEAWYVHMRNVRVRVGSRVKRGQQIGEVGATYPTPISPHLHVNHAFRGAQVQIEFHGRPYPASIERATRNVVGYGVTGDCPKPPPPPPPPSPPPPPGDDMPKITSYIPGYSAVIKNPAGARIRGGVTTSSPSVRVIPAGQSEAWVVVGWADGEKVGDDARWLARVAADGSWEYTHSSNVGAVAPPTGDCGDLQKRLDAATADATASQAVLDGVKKKVAAMAADVADD